MRVRIQDRFGKRSNLAHYVTLERLHEPCPPLAQYPELGDVVIQHCTFTSFPNQAFHGPGKAFKVGFYDSRADWAALFDQLLTHGAGRWRIGYAPAGRYRKKLKDVCRIGDGFLGNKPIRRLALALYQKHTMRAPTRNDLLLADWPQKTIRVRALEWLSALGRPEVPSSGRLLLAGTPQNRSIRELKQRLTDAGYTLVRSVDDADAVVVLSRPKGLDAVIASDVPLLFEPQLRAIVDAHRERGLEINAHQEAGLQQMLSNPDPDTVRQGLHLLEQVEFDESLLPELLVAMLFHVEADVRKSAKKLVLGRGPQRLVDYFQGNRTRWTGLSNTRRVQKLVQEMKGLGVDPKRFGLGMAVQQVARSSWDLPNFATALAPICGEAFFDAFTHVQRDQLTWLGPPPKGIHKLQVKHLRLHHGPHDLATVAGSPIQTLVGFGDGRWDLGPLVACPKLTHVKVTGDAVNYGALHDRGVQISRQ